MCKMLNALLQYCLIHFLLYVTVTVLQCLNCQKISGGLVTLVCTAASTYSLSLSLNTGDSASLTTAGVETDPPGYPRASCVWGVKQTTGGSAPRQFKHCCIVLQYVNCFALQRLYLLHSDEP
jgi:hypothetical protein